MKKAKSYRFSWKDWAIISILIVLIIAFICPFIIEKNKLNNVKELFENKEYEEAYTEAEAISLYTEADKYEKYSAYLIAENALDKEDFQKAVDYYDIADSIPLHDGIVYDMSMTNLVSRRNTAQIGVQKQKDYDTAESLLAKNKYKEAKDSYLKCGVFKDASEKVTECTYQLALEDMDKGNYDDAVDGFINCGDYKDSKTQIKQAGYYQACDKLQKKQYLEAYEAFELIGDDNFLDTRDKINDAKYGYCYENRNRTKNTPKATSEKVLQFLKELKSAKYSGASGLYDEYTKWHVEMIANTSAGDNSTNETTISRYTSKAYIHLYFWGGDGGQANYKLYGSYQYSRGRSSGGWFSYDNGDTKLRQNAEVWDYGTFTNNGTSEFNATFTVYDYSSGREMNSITIYFR